MRSLAQDISLLPFWVDGYGFKPAGELVEGDRVETAEGEILTVTYVEIEQLDEPVTVYNFEVADWHTYYVSEDEVLVHNSCGMPSIKVNVEATKADFIVIPNGTVMDMSKNYNLVGTGKNGDWFQIHNFGKEEPGFGFPHTHAPQMNTNGIYTSWKRVVSDTSAEDIDHANSLLIDGLMTIRKGKR